MLSLEHLWEREQVSQIQYLQTSEDPWLKGVLRFYADLCGRDDTNPLVAGRCILQQHVIATPSNMKEVREDSHIGAATTKRQVMNVPQGESHTCYASTNYRGR